MNERCKECGGLGYVESYDGHRVDRYQCPHGCPWERLTAKQHAERIAEKIRAGRKPVRE